MPACGGILKQSTGIQEGEITMNIGSENETCEFRKGLGQVEKGIRSLTAMLNAGGYGEVFFGVEENGNVRGIEVGRRTLSDIRGLIDELVEPEIPAVLEVLADELDRKYIKMSAGAGDRPYSFDGRYYTREGCDDKRMSPKALRKLILKLYGKQEKGTGKKVEKSAGISAVKDTEEIMEKGAAGPTPAVNDISAADNASASAPILTAGQQNVYRYLIANPDATLSQAAGELGLSLGGIKKISLRLQEIGLLEHIGSKRNGRWKEARQSC